MKIRLFVLGTDSSAADDLLDSCLDKTFSGFYGEEGIGYYPTVKDAAESVKTAFSGNDAVMFLAVPGYYGTAKKILSKAYGISLEKNNAVNDRANAYATDEMKKLPGFEETHSFLPAGGKNFITPDGLFSGFASVRGSQSVIILPYSADRTCNLLSVQVIPFLNTLYSVNISVQYSDHIYGEKLNRLLGEESVKIALAPTKTSDLFCEYVSTFATVAENIEKTPKCEERGNMRPSEYVVNLSIAAAELQGAPYGIVISNAYYLDEGNKNRLTVFMAVTNDSQTTVREVKSFAWENTAAFMKRCCGELCKLLSEIITTDRIGGGKRKPSNPKKALRARIAIAVTIIAIAALLITGWYIFSTNSYSVAEWAHTHFPSIFSESDGVINADELEGESFESEETSDALNADAGTDDGTALSAVNENTATETYNEAGQTDTASADSQNAVSADVTGEETEEIVLGTNPAEAADSSEQNTGSVG